MKLAKRLQGVVRVLDSLPLGVTVQSSRGDLLYANPIALNTLKTASKDDLRYKLKNGLFDELTLVDEDGKLLKQADLPGNLTLETKKPHSKLILYRHNSSKDFYWSLVKSTPVKDDNGKLLAVISLFDDYTQIKKSHDSLKVINNIVTYISSTTSFTARLKRFAQSVVPVFSDWCAIDVLEGRNIIRGAVSHVDPKKTKLAWGLSKKYPIKLSDPGGVSQVIKTGKPIFIPNITKEMYADIKDENLKSLILSLKLNSVVIAPIKSRKKTIGAITFVWAESGRKYTSSDLTFLTTLTNQVSILTDNARLFRKTKKTLHREKELAQKLHESQQTLNLALGAGKMSVWDWEIKPGQFFWSNGSENINEIKIGDFEGPLEEFSGHIYNEDRKRFLQATITSVKELKNLSIDLRTADTRNKLRWLRIEGQMLLDPKGKPERMVGVWRDITYQKNAEKRIFESERKFKSVVNSALDSIILFDSINKTIREVNNSACVMFNKPKANLINKKLTDFFEALPQSERGELTLRGEKGTVEYTQAVNFMDNMNLLFVRDISDRKIEEKRREHFLGIASHELKNPIASIKAYVEILKRAGINGGKTDVYLEKINERSEMLNRLINDLLDVTRIRQRKLQLSYEFMDLDTLVRDLIKVTKYVFRSHKILYKSVGPVEVVADKTRIVQVINNLIKNAVKYSPDANKIEIEVKKEKNSVGLTVRDFGVGIPRVEQKKIFELYHRGSGTGQIDGLGVGLFISEQIVSQHGGRFKVKSKVGKGSEFSFFLPKKPKVKRFNRMN